MMALGLFALLIGLWWFWGSSRQSLPLEVPRAGLESKGGRLYLIGQPKPFSGLMVDFYPDGKKRSRSGISNGLLNGISEGWHTNGQLEVREQFREGLSHGLRTKWYPTGAKLSEAMISAGKLHGTFRRWHENGKLAEQIEMRDGSAEGLSLAYYPSGYLKAQVRLVAGKPVEQKHWTDGESRGPTTEGVN
jgi:antitoxin component YwqK of YwqJK toxin-antitoxin module